MSIADPPPTATNASQGVARAPIAVRLARKHKPSAFGYLARESAPLPEERRGVAISTFGKVIRRGWDWLGLAPAGADRVAGLIEVPALAESLTLNKADFIRAGARGATYLAYRKAIQEAVARQLEAWGDAKSAQEPSRRRAVRPMERDLGDLLLDLASDFPLLAPLVEVSAGGQRRIPTARRAAETGEGTELVAASLLGGGEPASSGGGGGGGGGEVGDGNGAAKAPPEELPGKTPSLVPGTPAGRRAGRYGLHIDFESAPESPELARLVESTVWVNDAHPAYRRARESRTESYHVAVTVALALARLAVEPHDVRTFVTAFLSAWGERS